MIKEKLGKYLDDWIHAVFPFLFKRAIDPNLLTVFGTVVSIGAAWAFAEGELFVGALVMLAGGFFDLVDGVVARHFGSSTSFGGFLDSTMDRVVDIVLMAGLMIHYGREGDIGAQLLAAVVLTSSLVTSYAKARAELLIPRLGGGVLERGERVGILAAGGIFGVMVPALWVLALGTTFTAGQRIAEAYRALQALDASERPGAAVGSEPADTPEVPARQPDAVENA